MPSVHENTTTDQGPATIPARPRQTRTRTKAKTSTKAQAPTPAQAPGAQLKPKGWRGLGPLRRCSLVVGATGCSTLALSVVHCTHSIMSLTGSHWALAGALATTIDVGMITSEIAEVMVRGTAAAPIVGPWARTYVGLAISISMVLNAVGMAANAAPGMAYGSYALGLAVPVLVLILGRTAGLLWTA